MPGRAVHEETVGRLYTAEQRRRRDETRWTMVQGLSLRCNS